MTIQSTYQLDGKDYPITGSPNYDTISGNRCSNTANFTLKKAGKAVATTSRAVSKDGRTLTLKAKGTTAKGEKYDDVLVFDKQ